MASTPNDLRRHTCRIAASIAAFALAARVAPWPLWIAAAAASYLAAFSLAHDLVHGSLGLSRRGRALALGAAGQLMLLSGHGMRVIHLRHHAAPLSARDLEGAAVGVGWWTAIRALPRLLWASRVEPLRARTRRSQAIESALNLALIAAALASGSTAACGYVATALIAQLTAPLWAGRLSHQPPTWLLRFARALAWVPSPAILSLAFHDVHHAHPNIPCQQLAAR